MPRCKLCGNIYEEKKMSEEHYPAKSVGNEDLIVVDAVEMLDHFRNKKHCLEIMQKLTARETFEEVVERVLDDELCKEKYPEGRTAKTLCIECNRKLGYYDEAYLKFYKTEGNPKIVNGFQELTKYRIIKAIYGKFLSIPEADNEEFDFVDFVNNTSSTNYNGSWNLYFVRRDMSTDILGIKDISTGKITFKEGVVYEFSDEKFIFNLMNFEKHPQFEMTNIWDILNKNYNLVVGVGHKGGYHWQIIWGRTLRK